MTMDSLILVVTILLLLLDYTYPPLLNRCTHNNDSLAHHLEIIVDRQLQPPSNL
jgi:hypothetical protein